MQLQYELATILRRLLQSHEGTLVDITWNGTVLFTGIENCVSSSPDILPVPPVPGQGTAWAGAAII